MQHWSWRLTLLVVSMVLMVAAVRIGTDKPLLNSVLLVARGPLVSIEPFAGEVIAGANSDQGLYVVKSAYPDLAFSWQGRGLELPLMSGNHSFVWIFAVPRQPSGDGLATSAGSFCASRSWQYQCFIITPPDVKARPEFHSEAPVIPQYSLYPISPGRLSFFATLPSSVPSPDHYRVQLQFSDQLFSSQPQSSTLAPYLSVVVPDGGSGVLSVVSLETGETLYQGQISFMAP